MFPGKIDAHRENQAERRKQDERVNAGVLAKKKHLEEFIAKNKARASTATLAKSKAKQLERLELTAIAADEPTARIRTPRVDALTFGLGSGDTVDRAVVEWPSGLKETLSNLKAGRYVWTEGQGIKR